MKTKKRLSKLTLNKETIANLKVMEVKDIQGGAGEGGTETYWPLSYCCTNPPITCTMINELCGLTQTTAPEPTCTIA
jgi:hypothetical protein